MPIDITDPADPRIAAYRDIKDRDLGRHSRFIVEGTIALEKLLRASRFAPHSLLITESRRAPLAPLLEYLAPAIPIYVAAQPVMDAITGFHIHRGVLALARRTDSPTAAELIAQLPPGPATVLAVIGLSNHDNVGACFRNAAALGAQAVLLDETSCDPLYRKAIRVSSGAALSIPFAHAGDGAQILEALAAARFSSWALAPAGGEALHTLDPPERLALVLGAEGPGLPDAILARNRRVSIPMAGGMDSLNVATAGAVALAHVLARRLTSRA